MQNAKCKIYEAFCFAKAYLVVIFCSQKAKKSLSLKENLILHKNDDPSFVPNFAFCILNFAFRAPPDKPKFEVLFDMDSIPQSPKKVKGDPAL